MRSVSSLLNIKLRFMIIDIIMNNVYMYCTVGFVTPSYILLLGQKQSICDYEII